MGTSEQKQRLLAGRRAKLKPGQKECGPARRDADLIDDRQIQGNWIDSYHSCTDMPGFIH